jgi:hypothetical protein
MANKLYLLATLFLSLGILLYAEAAMVLFDGDIFYAFLALVVGAICMGMGMHHLRTSIRLEIKEGRG